MNTVVDYLYRDASNYKVCNHAIVEGTLTEAEIKEIISCCDEGMYFIPHQVGLPEERFNDITADDHPWFELGPWDFSLTDHKPTCDVTAKELLEAFRKVDGNWDSEEPSVITKSNVENETSCKRDISRNKKTALCFSSEEFIHDVKDVFGDTVEVDIDWEGIVLKIPYCGVDEIHSRLAAYYGVGKITSIHVDDYEATGVWVIYVD